MLVDIFIYINEHVRTPLFISDTRDIFAESDDNLEVVKEFYNFLVSFTM